jgi:hypothetical protein
MWFALSFAFGDDYDGETNISPHRHVFSFDSRAGALYDDLSVAQYHQRINSITSRYPTNTSPRPSPC